MPHLDYTKVWGIAESLQDPLLLASINYGDNDEVIKKKIVYSTIYRNFYG